MNEPQLFSAVVPHLALAWDSTTLSDFRRCPRLYYYRHIENWRGRHDSDDLTFGLLFHSALEKYDHMKAAGVSHSESVRAAVFYAMTHSGKRDADGVWQPWMTPNPYKNRFTLVRTIVWYICQFKYDAFLMVKRPDGRPAVELSFKIELPLTSPDGQPYLLCGHIDKVVTDGHTIQYLDRKTTKTTLSSNYFSKYSPHTQMSCYAVATKVLFNISSVTGIIDAAQVAVNFSRFERGALHRTNAQLDEWLRDTLYWIKRAEDCARDGYWPQNDQACDMYGGCKFRTICAMDPSAREMFLQEDFVRGEQWNPMISRGE